MTYALGRSLLLTEAISSDDLARAVYAAATEGAPLVRALLAVGAITPPRLADELAKAEAPVVNHVVPVPELMNQLPTGLCSRLLAIPVRKDPRTGTVDVAVADARDPHPPAEIGFFLKAPVRVVRAPLRAIESALDQLTSAPQKPETLAAPIWVVQRTTKSTPIWGSPIPRASTIPPPAGHVVDSTPPPPPFSKSPSAMPPPVAPISAATALSSLPPPIPLMRRSMRSPESMRSDFHPPPSTSPYGAIVPDTVREPVELVSSIPPAPLPLRSLRAAREPANAPPQVFADPAALLASIRGVNTRDEIMAVLLIGLRTIARKGALFVVKKDAFVGWSCNPEFGDETKLKTVKIPTNRASVLASAANGNGYLGPIYAGDVHDPLLEVMGSTSNDVAVTAVRVKGHPAVMMMADELADTMVGTYRMEEMARAAGETLARIVKRGK